MAIAIYKSLTEQAYDKLLTEIVEGRLPPGTPLDQRGLASRLGMSPIPVREALRQLERDGLVEMRPRWPARVKIQDSDFIREEYVLREALESQAARLCAENATDEQLETLARIGADVDRLLSRRRAGEEGPRVHLDFHMSVARFSGCSALARELEKINLRLIIRRNWTRAIAVPHIQGRHHEFVSAVASRDVEEADRAAREHVRRGLAHELAIMQAMGL